MANLLRKTLAAGIAILACAGIAKVLPMGLANAFHFKSRHYLDLWAIKGAIDRSQFDDALAAAERAVELDGEHPHYLLTLAKVVEWGQFSGWSSLSHQQINGLYDKAIALRPNWPNAYADYAYQQAFYQQNFTAAWSLLPTALTFGPYTPEVHRNVLAIGFAFWTGLTTAQRALVFASVDAAVRAGGRPYHELKSLAKQYHLQSTLCRYIPLKHKRLSAEKLRIVQRDFCR